MNSEMDLQRNKQKRWFHNAPSNTSSHNKRRLLTNFKCTFLTINTVLLPLKIALFCFYGGSLFMTMMLPVYFNQIGLSLSEFSVANVATAVSKVIGSVISGLVADKTGRSKIVLQANIILSLIFANICLLIPKIEHHGCLPSAFEVKCNSTIPNASVSENFNNDNFNMLSLKLRNCSIRCSLQELRKHELLGEMTVIIPAAAFSKEETQFCLKDMQYNDTCVVEGMSNSLNNSWCEMDPLCSLLCPINDYEHCSLNKTDNSNYTYILCFIVIVCIDCTLCNCYLIMDATAMSMVKKHNADYGRERFWGILGTLILSPLAGYLIKITTPIDKPQNYVFIFYFFDILTIITMLAVMKLDVKIDPPGKSMWTKTIALLKEPAVVMFAVAVLILGTSWTFYKYFSFLFLVDMNAPPILLGLLPSVSCLAGLPFLATSNWWVKKIGSSNLLILGLISYAAVSIGYSFLIQPWYALLYAVFEVFTFHLLWVAVVRHSHKIAPEGLVVSVMATAGSLHYGIGKGTGSSIGLIMNKYGGRIAFRFIAIMCALTAFVYITFAFLRSRYRVKDQPLKEEENVQNDSKHTSIACAL